MKPLLILAAFSLLRLHAQDISLATMPENSRMTAQRMYYAQTGNTNLAGVVAKEGQAIVMIPNRFICTTCGGRGKKVHVVPGKETKASKDGLILRGKRTTTGHTGRSKGMDRRYLIDCPMCEGDGLTDQSIRIVK